MAVTCTSCGNTSNPTGATICSICGAYLSSGGSSAPLSKPGPRFAPPPPVVATTSPMLVDPGGRRYRLNAAGDTYIGSRGCAILLAAPGVAPQHAKVSPSGSGFVVEALGGGIRVNGAAVAGATPLQPSDTLTIGPVQLVYQGPATPALVASSPKAPLAPPPPFVPPPKVVTPPKVPLVVTPPAAGLLADGEVRTVDPERLAEAPRDVARSLVMVTVVLVVVGVGAVALFYSLIVLLVLIAFGLGALAFVFPLLFGPIRSGCGALFSALQGRKMVPTVNFQLFDTLSGMPVDVAFIRKRAGTGNVRLGDKARIYGTRDRQTMLLRAYKIEIYESGGYPTRVILPGEQPWPLWIGLLVLALALGGLVYAATHLL